MGRDVGRDEGRDQAAWRDLVARLELMSPVDPADAPWPDRENLPAKPHSNPARQFTDDDLFAPGEATFDQAAPSQAPANENRAGETAASEAKVGEAATGQANDAAEITDGETTAPTTTAGQGGSSGRHAKPSGAPGSPAGGSEAKTSGTETNPDQADPDEAKPGGTKPDGAEPAGTKPDGTTSDGTKPDRRPPVTHSRIIRPAPGYPRFGRVIPRQVGPSARGHDQDAARPGARRSGGPFDPLEGEGPDDHGGMSGGMSGMGGADTGGPRDFQLADDTEFDFGDGDRYIPPPLPPLGGVDPATAFGWMALFGGPAYLLISMVADWQTPRWAALLAVVAFVTGFIVLVFKLGDGPSKRDGPDQGAVV